MLIRTERLLLREFRLDDLDAVFRYESDPRVVQYVCYGPFARAECRQDLAFHVAQQRAQPRMFLYLAIVPQDQTRPVGWCGIKITDHAQREGELGYALPPDYWGRGYSTEAAWAMLACGFDQPRLHRIIGACHPDNRASIRVLEKLGMRAEGLLRENKWCRDRWRDTLIFALLEREWQRPPSMFQIVT